MGGTGGSELAGMPIDDPAAYHLPAARTDFVFCLIGTGVQQDQTFMVMLGAVLYAVSCVLAYALYVRYRDLYRKIEKPESSEDNDDDDATTDTGPPA